MQKPVAGARNMMPSAGMALAVCSVCFFLGGLAGCMLAFRVSGGGSESMDAYIGGFLDAAGKGVLAAPPLLPLAWSCMRWPLLALLLGFTAAGLLGLPVLFAARGFLLAFSIASFVRTIGAAGCLLSLALFGLTGAVSVPVFFVLGVQSFLSARDLAGRFGSANRAVLCGAAYFRRCGVCAAALVLCAALEYLLVPTLVSGLAEVLLAI